MFDGFAYLYDELNVNYEKDGIVKRLKALLAGTRDVVDLCCGTGDVAIAMSKCGMNVIGIDLSEDMLNIATEKAMKSAARVLFVQGDARSFELPKKADAVYSITDGMNYMLDTDSLYQAFSAVQKALKPNGKFIFDISTRYKYENVLKKNAFTFDFDDEFVAWQNDYSEETNICEMNITCFTKSGKNGYKRFDETHYQRSYTVDEIAQTLDKAGFELLNVYDGYTDKPVREISERAVLEAQKR